MENNFKKIDTNQMFDKKKNFKCKECGMQFNDLIRLERHSKIAHPAKHGGFKSKWYWEN
jgi:protein-arginine kinase activator protein McsA